MTAILGSRVLFLVVRFTWQILAAPAAAHAEHTIAKLLEAWPRPTIVIALFRLMRSKWLKSARLSLYGLNVIGTLCKRCECGPVSCGADQIVTRLT